MNENNGWISLHRKIIEWEWFDDHNTFRLFIFLLLTANHKDKKWRGITIKRGQKLTGIFSLSKQTGLSVRQVRTSLDKLKLTGELTSKTTNKYSILTLLNYDEYQTIDKQVDKRVTNERQTNDKQTTTNNNDNNVIKKKKINKKEKFENKFLIFWDLYPRKISKTKAYTSWLKLSEEEKDKCILVIPDHTQQEQWLENDGKFIPHPTTWLNGGRWEDDIIIHNVEEL